MTARPIFDHIVLGDLTQSKLTIEALDKPGAGGASHLYVIEGFDTVTNPSDPRFDQGSSSEAATILFQNGPIPAKGMNGVTQEALLAIVIDRLKGFQKGNYACRENAIALTKLQEALFWLKYRTEERLRRGVEGTLTR